MSQRPPASRPASRSPPDPPRITLPPVQLRDDLQQGGREDGRQQLEIEGRGHPLTSAQLPRTGQMTPSGDNWRGSAPLRDLGVHSILNPTEPEGSGLSSRRLSSAASESPSSAVGLASQFAPSPSTATQHTFPGQQPISGAPPTGESYGGTLPRVRKILTPRSPSRTLSSGRGGGRGTIDAQRSPFLPSRGRQYTVEPGQDVPPVPPMPTPPGNPQQQYGFPSAASTPNVNRRTSGGTMQAPGHAPLSQSASPSISASSHNPLSSQTSPASIVYHKGPQTATPYFPGSSFGGTSVQQGGGMQFPGASAAPEGPYSAQAPPQAQGGSSLHSSSAGSSRQTSASDPIQVLTITTSQGQYTVPVDVHQASRLADEKRARNAGASARFRQRRKEKEKEASSNIEKLNQQTRDLERRVREVEQERDFYRAERDRFREVIYRTPEMRHLAMQAPPSPHTMRSASFPAPMQQMGGPSPPIGFQPAASTPQERAPRRRRTDARGDFASVSYSLPPASTLPPVQSTGYAPPGPAQATQNLPPLRIENTSTAQATSSMTASTTSEAPQPPHGPYSRNPYERGWPGEGGRR